MDRVAVFVDAGYLFVEGSRALSGQKLARSAIVLDHRVVIARLARFARDQSGLPLLRIYWYDATANRPTRTQIAVAEQADVKLRLGRVNSAGRQKGVDAMIASDLVALARNRAMTDCVLLSGDDELRIAVTEIQQLGVRVHLVGIEPASSTQSELLRREADSTIDWGAETLGVFMHCRSRGQGRSGLAGQRAAGVVHRTEQGLRLRGPRRVEPVRSARVVRDLVRQVLIREFAARTGRFPQSLADAALHADLRGEPHRV